MDGKGASYNPERRGRYGLVFQAVDEGPSEGCAESKIVITGHGADLMNWQIKTYIGKGKSLSRGFRPQELRPRTGIAKTRNCSTIYSISIHVEDMDDR